jgi:serine protease Do
MKRGYLSVICAVLIALGASAYGDQAAEEVFKAIVKIRSIVPSDARTARLLGIEREGNGVVIDANGHVLTIGYLILEAETIEVIGPEGKAVKATFVGYDHDTGFGLLRTNKPLSVVPMKLGQSSEIKVGDPVLVAGYGGPDAVQTTRVVSRSEFAGYWEYLLEDAIFTAPHYPSFGGAALIGHGGRLLGIGSLLTQVMIPGFGSIPCNMFVPINLLKPILADLTAIGRSRESPRPWLGLYAEETHGRVFVIRVTSGGPAEKAGLQPGDIILTVNKKAVNALADFYRKVWALGSAGVDVPLSVLQGIQIRDIIVHSANRSEFLRFKPKRREGTQVFIFEFPARTRDR